MVRPLMWVGEPARIYKKVVESNNLEFKSQIFNMGYDNENYKKIEIAEIVKTKFLKILIFKLLTRIQIYRSYRLDFSKMKN